MGVRGRGSARARLFPAPSPVFKVDLACKAPIVCRTTKARANSRRAAVRQIFFSQEAALVFFRSRLAGVRQPQPRTALHGGADSGARRRDGRRSSARLRGPDAA